LFGIWLYNQAQGTVEHNLPSGPEAAGLRCLKIDAQSKDCSAVLEVADTSAERAKGLSGREKLSKGRGMVFIFQEPGTQCFWMKDTLIPLDMIWLDKDKKVTKTQENVLPATYPDQFCSIEPKDQYVIELNSGDVKKLEIKTGQTLSF
jgi:uncharacterized membrane protein (UPF0127 family)